MVAVLLYHRQGIAWHIDREPIWNNALEWAAENIRKANIGVKVVYEWVDEPTADLTEVGLALSEREDIQSVIGCNVADNTQKLAFALARKKENIKPLFTFSTSQELPRIFGHRGFLWGLCETDISQSEIMLSCISNENPGLKKVALLAVVCTLTLSLPVLLQYPHT